MKTPSAPQQLFRLLRSGSAQEISTACGEKHLNLLIPGLQLLIGCEQSLVSHLEGDVATHTGLVVAQIRNAALRRLNREADDVELIAALIHDLKKPETKVTSSTGEVRFTGHEERAASECPAIGATLGLSTQDIERLTFVGRNHGEAHLFTKLDEEGRAALVRSPFAISLALLQEADALGAIRSDGSQAPVYWGELCAESLDARYFDAPVDRRAHRSIKWNTYPQDVLPLWVADMDFRSPPAVVDAHKKRVEHGEFGYEESSARLLATIAAWCATRYDWEISTEEIVPLPGLVCALNTVCRVAGSPGDSAIVFTPVYPPFLSSPTNSGMKTIEVPLTQVTTGESFHYTIDLDLFARSITPSTKVCILCHPHNPSGESWSTETLRSLAALCEEKGILLCSDEIHCDLILDGSAHTPSAKAAPQHRDNLITLMAPSKTFNLPGLGYSFAIIHNPELRKRFKRAIDGPIPHPNAMGIAACEAALKSGSGWLREVCQYITANRDLAVTFIRENIPGLQTTCAARTYLLWIDCRGVPAIADAPSSFFLKSAKVALNDGALFGEAGRGFVRLNLGAPRALLLEALHRLKEAVDSCVDK